MPKEMNAATVAEHAWAAYWAAHVPAKSMLRADGVSLVELREAFLAGFKAGYKDGAEDEHFVCTHRKE